MDAEFRRQLESFIVRAKSHTYVGSAKKLLPYRLGSKDSAKPISPVSPEKITAAEMAAMIRQSLTAM